MTYNLDSRLEKLEALAPPRDRLVVRILGDIGYADKYVEAERQAKEQGKDLLVIHRRIVTPGNAEVSA